MSQHPDASPFGDASLPSARTSGRASLPSALLDAERALERAEQLQGLTAALSRTLTVDDVARVVIEAGLQAMDAPAGNLALVEEGRARVRIVRSVGHDRAFYPEWEVPLTDRSPIPLAITTRSIVSYTSSEERRERFGSAAPPPYEAGISVPLVIHERAVGSWGLSFHERRAFSTEDREFLRAIGEQAAQALERAQLIAAERRARDEAWAAQVRTTTILESIGDGFVSVGRDGRFSYANRQAARLLGCDAESLLGRPMWEVFPHHPDAPFRRGFERAIAQHEPCTLEDYGTSTHRWLEMRVYPGAEGVSIFFRDVTVERQAKEWNAFLGRAVELLASSIHPEEMLERLSRICVPAIADLCVVYFADEHHGLRAVATSRADERGGRDGVAASTASTAMRVARTRQPELVTELETLRARGHVSEPLLLDAVDRLALRSAIFVPLASHGRTLGVVTALTTCDSGRRYSERDLELVSQLAARASVALEHARLYREAVDANAAKANFLAVMSHELRTPLTAIIGYAELLADGIAGPVNDVQHEQLSRVKSSGMHLLTLIEEILRFARIEAGQEGARIEAVDARDLVRQVDAIAGPLAELKGLRRALTVPDDPLPVHTDPGKVCQILVNLHSNAVKFTECGEVRLEAACDDGRVLLRVRDTGIGIAREHLERIFDPFWQVERSDTRRAGGTGLGLTVVRRLATLLGAEIRVDSDPGAGTTVTLVLANSLPA